MSAAMSYGFSLGIFWIVKYIFYMFSMRFSYLVVIYWGMSLVVPYLAYLLTKRYREDLGGIISFSTFFQEAFGMFQLKGIIMIIRLRSETNFFHNDLHRFCLLFFLTFLLLVEELLIVNHSTNGGRSIG